MNTVEGSLALGRLSGAVLAYLIRQGISWQWLYVLPGACVLSLLTALRVRYPDAPSRQAKTPDGVLWTVLKNKFVLMFSLGAFLYVAVKAAIYVDADCSRAIRDRPAGSWHSISIFFALRAMGRFLGAWMLHPSPGYRALLCSGAILACFVASIAGRHRAAVYCLPLSGLFMS
jgi:fucose permease